MLLENQKHLFSLPDDVHYLNCATMSPVHLWNDHSDMEIFTETLLRNV
jgi:hypothetical protein